MGLGMLIALPAWFAFGFCLGYFLARWGGTLLAFLREPASPEIPSSAHPRRDGRGWALARDKGNPSAASPDDAWIWVVVSLVALTTLAIIYSGWLMADGHLLWIAAMAVGAMGGQWFATNGSRDQLALITGAGAFLFVVALDYDNKLFRKLSKIGGTEFNLEFANEPRSQNQNKNPVLSFNSDESFLNVVFPGDTGLRFAIGYLATLPRYIRYDEQYANLFSQ
jgi:hypothetical protein